MAENEDDDELSVDDSSLEEVIESKTETKPDDMTIQNEKDFNSEDKNNKIKKILFFLIAFLSFSIIVVLILYFSDFFNVQAISSSNEKQNKIQVPLEKNENDFIETDIDISKLNNKLKLLTKKELNFDNDEEIKKEKKLEEKKIYEDKKKFDEFKKQARIEARLEEEQKKLEEEKKKLEIQKQELEKKRDELEKLQEENMYKKIKKELENKTLEKQKEIKKIKYKSNPKVDLKDNKTKQVDIKKKKKIIQKQEKNNLQSFVKLINVASIKGELYKSYLKKIERINRSLLLCRDHLNRIDIYFGPYLDEKERKKTIQKLFDNGFDKSYGIDLTQEEYKNRCKY